MIFGREKRKEQKRKMCMRVFVFLRKKILYKTKREEKEEKEMITN